MYLIFEDYREYALIDDLTFNTRRYLQIALYF